MQQITAGQIEQFIAVVRTGNVSRVEFQVWLDEPASIVKLFKSGPREPEPWWYQNAVAFWEERFPGKGQALVELLAPFYRIKKEWEENGTPFPVKRVLRATASLKRRCREAIFWRPWQGLVIIQDRQAIWASLRARLGDILDDSLRASVRAILWVSLEDDSIWGSIWGSLRESFMDDSLRASVRAILWDSLIDGLEFSLFYACGFLIAGIEEKTEAFRELLGLWAEGIIPAGFDKQGRLIIYIESLPPAK